MTKNRFYIVVITGLLISNLLLIFFGFHKARHPKIHKAHNPRAIIIERLQFDAQQIKQYDALIAPHRKEIKTKDSALLVLKNKLYNLLASSEDIATQRDSLLMAISRIQQDIEQVHFNHFMAIRQICKPDQMDEFKELSNEISRLFSIPNRPRK